MFLASDAGKQLCAMILLAPVAAQTVVEEIVRKYARRKRCSRLRHAFVLLLLLHVFGCPVISHLTVVVTTNSR